MFSSDFGVTWFYEASKFQPIGGGQRLVLKRLREGPLFFFSFGKDMIKKDVSGKSRTVSRLFAALSFDESNTWPIKRLITDDGPPREIDGGGNTGIFTLS